MWEYVKGSDGDFQGAPEWCTHVSSNNSVVAWEESSRGIPGNRYQWRGKEYIDNYGEYAGGELAIIAERRKVDGLQSRVNDANLGDALKEMFKEDTHGANKDQFAHLNDLPLVSEKYDTVQRPAHYNQSGIECIDAIAASMTPAEFQAYLKGNVQKYLWRYQHKNGVEDCRKAQWYLDRLVKELSK